MLGLLGLRYGVRSEQVLLSKGTADPGVVPTIEHAQKDQWYLSGTEHEIPGVQVGSHLTFQTTVGDGYHLDDDMEGTGMECVTLTYTS